MRQLGGSGFRHGVLLLETSDECLEAPEDVRFDAVEERQLPIRRLALYGPQVRFFLPTRRGRAECSGGGGHESHIYDRR